MLPGCYTSLQHHHPESLSFSANADIRMRQQGARQVVLTLYQNRPNRLKAINLTGDLLEKYVLLQVYWEPLPRSVFHKHIPVIETHTFAIMKVSCSRRKTQNVYKTDPAYCSVSYAKCVKIHYIIIPES